MKIFRSKKIVRIAGFAIVICLATIAAVAQGTNPSLTGKYQGTAKSPDGEVQLKLELTDDGGKISGQVTSPHGVYKITKAQVTDGVLTLDAEGTNSKGKMTLRQKGDVLAGEFTADGKTGSVEFKKSAADDISGEWDAVADAQGQPFPFTLVLKLDGDKITGSSNSQLGLANITEGTWKEGKLAVALEGNITLVATMVEGKLSGDYDFQGQTSGKWVAVKKK
ncbi:MAG TPA: hypothetical protein VE863_00760 [Pyrinomonadaceae bacterium]|nr:hypothetical protein [Pyrinomonadaceae bacterium]